MTTKLIEMDLELKDSRGAGGDSCSRKEGRVDSSLLEVSSWSSPSEGVDAEMGRMSYSEIMDRKICSL